ncbi:MAG: response regulator [Bacteroidetes bacterium]|nr:response regulator [Bacteroidota bacterium]
MDGKTHILVVDDEVNSAENEQFILEKNGFKVSMASSGEAAFRFLLTTIPDLILLDVVLPDFPGNEFCKAIKTDPRYAVIPVILLSGLRISDEERNAGFTAGASDYITRPFRNDDLVNRIRTSLSKAIEREDLASSQREMIAFHNLSRREAGETSLIYNAVSLKIQYPESFQNILKEYDSILNDAIEERFFRVEQHLHEKLNHLSNNLGFLKAGAKDIMDIHRECIIARINKANMKEQKVVLEESRLLLIELMGNMINYYRRKSK